MGPAGGRRREKNQSSPPLSRGETAVVSPLMRSREASRTRPRRRSCPGSSQQVEARGRRQAKQSGHVQCRAMFCCGGAKGVKSGSADAGACREHAE